MSLFTRSKGFTVSTLFATVFMTSLGCLAAHAQAKTDTSKMPWMNKALSRSARRHGLSQMTLDEKIQMVHGTGWGVLRAGDPSRRSRTLLRATWRASSALAFPASTLRDSAVGARMAALSVPLRYAAALDAWRGFKLGPGVGFSLRLGHRPRASRAGLKYVNRRRREYHA